MALSNVKIVLAGSILSWVFCELALGGHTQPRLVDDAAAPAAQLARAVELPDGASPAARGKLPDQYAGVQWHADNPGISAFYGKPMTTGATPVEAADRCLATFGAALGVRSLDLRLARGNQVHFGKFTVFAYQQFIEGLPVEHGIARVLVLNGVPNRAVYFAGKLAQPPAQGFRAATVGAAAAVAGVQAMALYEDLDDWPAPELVAFCARGVAAGEPAIRAWKFTGSRMSPGEIEGYTFFVNAADGSLVYVRDEIYNTDITGHVSGLATPGTLPDTSYNPPVEMSLEDVTIKITGGGNTFTNTNGDYVLPWDGAGPALVEANLISRWVQVYDYSGEDLHLWEYAAGGDGVDFLFNPVPEEYLTAQVNGFMRTVEVHDFYKDRQPDFEELDMPITCVVNYPGVCNAFYYSLYQVMAFFTSGGGCVNMAYANVVAHEYGHFIVNRLDLRQYAFGEGFADTVSILLYDDPLIGRDVRGPDTYYRNIATADEQYPCHGEIHDCGQVLAGCWWDIRLALGESLGDPEGLDLARQLFVDWSQITVGGLYAQSAHPLTAVEVLTIADDDGDLSNGTPHQCEICLSFAAHGIACPPAPEDCTGNGIPDECEPDCNSNGVADSCDIAAGTSEDCQFNNVPDECDLILGTSRDCNGNAVPDECDLAAGTSSDCQSNGIPDECDIAAGSSPDCQPNGVPDECEPDCNANNVADECDIREGTSPDCNLNQRPDECDVPRCVESMWHGFSGLGNNTPLHNFNRIPWDEPDSGWWNNPAGNAIISRRGCEGGGLADKAVQISVPSASGGPPDWYVTSERLQPYYGMLPPAEAIYSLSFRVRFDLNPDPGTDWEFSLHDATNGERAVTIRFSSTVSWYYPGSIMVWNPLGGYDHTGVEIEQGRCYEVLLVLDNDAGAVGVYIDGILRVLSPLSGNARRMDYFRVEMVGNGSSNVKSATMKLDHFDMCLTGGVAVPQDEITDCNINGVLDECDISGGTSTDFDLNGVPDECETCGDFDGDQDVDEEDYQLLLGAFGSHVGDAEYLLEVDIDRDGAVTLADYQLWIQCYRAFIRGR